ncbi:hypothetical protein DSCO28_21210 [Desulfosarcina ovata subsp. sediminis]|uniref:Uncharacterized protein n=1 Tax=Desulfosarcina ovata subsp. sediminis TaxID=885957 RepID=A0A5K7ZMF3_9BACT|nr:hypothetical protein DSCO28_21210 [Desulfosarcina ovata subsp. sediminis]
MRQQFFGEGLGKLAGFKKAFIKLTSVVTFSFSGNRTQPLKNAFEGHLRVTMQNRTNSNTN